MNPIVKCYHYYCILFYNILQYTEVQIISATEETSIKKNMDYSNLLHP